MTLDSEVHLPSSPNADTSPQDLRRPWYRRRTWVPVGAALVVVIVAVAVVVTMMRETDLEAAVTACELTENEFVVVGDNGHTLTLDGANSDGEDGVAVADQACVLRELKVSTAAVTQMDSTTSLQGRQSASWSDVQASWSYHPDNGLDLILTNN